MVHIKLPCKFWGLFFTGILLQVKMNGIEVSLKRNKSPKEIQDASSN